MEPFGNLNQDTDDLPLRANTNHILVRHYVLELTVHFDRKVIGGSVVLFLEPCSGVVSELKDDFRLGAGETVGKEATVSQDGVLDRIADGPRGLGKTTTEMEKIADSTKDRNRAEFQSHTSPDTETAQSSELWQTTSDGDFTLVLDCCELDVSKVEELDHASVCRLLPEAASERSGVGSADLRAAASIQNLISMPSTRWRQKRRLFSQCSRAPGSREPPLHFHRDRWSLQVRKKGAATPQGFPRAIRICYETRPTGGSVRWTNDQDKRLCVYTAGSPINNRALFPCQEPPAAMSTWQATVRAPSKCVVLMSGEEQTAPTEDTDTRFLSWNYYVTMPMPASTFTLAVGHWGQVTAKSPPALERGERDRTAKLGDGPGDCSEPELVSGLGGSNSGGQPTRSDSAFSPPSPEAQGLAVTDCSGAADDGISCSHVDYPCRFTELPARSQRVIPHRVFGPGCLMHKAQMAVLELLPRCLAAAHTVLGVHPFSRLDVLIVPAGFSSLGMASPHIMFLSQSVLCGGQSLCGSRICHEIAHSWFGLLIGARDWTEEWLSEGFATYLEDIIWAQAQQLSAQETADESDLKALLRWRRLSDELQNSEEVLQILRPNNENTGRVSGSGSSTVKHALNPDKAFMQVHYLKGYFLLRYLASEVGQQRFIGFFRLFVKKYHGQLILSQDFLRMLLITFPDLERKGLTLSAIYAEWLDRPGIPKWLCERSAVWSQARLVEQVKAEVVKWIPLLSQSRPRKGGKRKRTQPKVNRAEVTSEQLVMLLELLLEEERLSSATMSALQKTYSLRHQDAEVRHRWCELVVKHSYTQAYPDVQQFLVHDQAMGVYLYGELMVQEDAEQQALARRCLSLVQEEMDQSARRVVEEMVL